METAAEAIMVTVAQGSYEEDHILIMVVQYSNDGNRSVIGTMVMAKSSARQGPENMTIIS